MIKFPLNADELTPALLTEALRERYPDVRVKAFQIIDSSTYGDGLTSTADRISLTLEYDDGSNNLPSQMLLKTLLVEAHVPLTMYENEVLFYDNIRPQLTIETPQVYASVFDGETGQFGILMEDLRLRQAQFPRATQSLNLIQMKNILEVLATLHAQYWVNPLLDTDWNWLPTAASGGMADVFREPSWVEMVNDMATNCEVKIKYLKQLGKTVHQLYDYVWRVNDGIFTTEPKTFLHGDCHMANIYTLPDNQMGLIDWQLASRGCWAQDFAYLIMTALDTKTRRLHQKELLQYYLECLDKSGVKNSPEPGHAWNLYRQSAIWGLAIGWMGCPVENYGPEILDANMQRLTDAVIDLETFEAINNG